jgi:predicted secreted Zn-dependent protease
MPVLPSFGPGSFPASASVTVSYYAVSGSSPQQIHASIQENGPWSDWVGRNAQAHVQASPSFNFAFRSDGYGCAVVPTGGDFVTITYHVLLPTWTPPTGVSQRTIDWWIETIHDTVAHEGHHITLYEGYRPLMHDAVRTGTCASVPADLERIFTDAQRANCEFDLAEYGYALGLTLESCLTR